MTVQNDKALDIALGNSRRTKTWKNKAMRWSELLDRLETTTRTSETVAEIMGQPIEWAPGLLLRGDGYAAKFYMKD